MAQGSGEERKRLVLHTAQSRSDLISVYAYNLFTYGEEHAERFLTFVESELQRVADDPGIGALIEFPLGVRLYLVRKRAKRGSHGYRVFYKEVQDGIEIIRILHSASDWTAILKMD